MGTSVSKRRQMRAEAISSAAIKFRAVKSFGDYVQLGHMQGHERGGTERCLSEPGVEASAAAAVVVVVSASAATTPSPCLQPPSLLQQKRRLSLSRSFSDEAAERTPATPAPSPSVPSIPSSSPSAVPAPPPPPPPPPPDPGLLQPPKVYTILGDERDYGPPSPPPPPSRSASARTSPAAGCSHGGGGHSKENKGRRHLRWLHAISRGSHFSGSGGSSSSAGSSRDGGGGGSSVRERDSLECPACESLGVFKHSFDLEQEKAEQEALNSKKKLERMYSMDRISDDIECRSWFPSESMHMLHSTASTLQAAFRGYAERKRRKRELDPSAMVQRNFHKHLRMVGRHRGRAAVSLDRQESRECGRALPLSDVSQSKSDPVLDARFSHDMQSTYERLHREPNSARWEEEREIELESCSRTDFIPPKVMLISSKVPKAEYIPNIIRKDDPSIIAILYDHEHATFSDILDEIEKKLNEYRRGCKIWKLLIYCQGGPGYLYLLKNKVATFAKLEKEDDLIMFWKCLGSLMSKINTELNVVHIMGCYVLGNHNGEKLLDSLKSIMGPYRVSFESPLELSAQGKKMIETYFSFRLYKLWKARQHSKLVDDFDEIL
ncbi:NMDA receptor synaptonuclear signaling and neuronal migration factor [Petromyzon marinus]|uniref:NMDA receptor synaptonuclear signaling and neuronal migration factor isoform X2 n=1 Tax=Petromyzon marinus TaxID=7757 RepID=A0AAJ7TBH8_PETMA|nr:NMDA receptor synaptonuclear signaling and neuronal migration factor isoform X2 [Petromyzon marinus]